jgi:hypothetical protein
MPSFFNKRRQVSSTFLLLASCPEQPQENIYPGRRMQLGANCKHMVEASEINDSVQELGRIHLDTSEEVLLSDQSILLSCEHLCRCDVGYLFFYPPDLVPRPPSKGTSYIGVTVAECLLTKL